MDKEPGTKIPQTLCERGCLSRYIPENILMDVNATRTAVEMLTVASSRSPNVECGTCSFLDTGGQRAPEGTGG